MIHNRLPFLEVLSYEADFPITDALFTVSEPVIVSGVETRVTITPKQTDFFGEKTINYRRFDLSELPRIKMRRLNAKTHSDLAYGLRLYPLFKYRLFDRRFPDQIAIRYLKLQPLDIQDEVLPNLHVTGQNFELHASPSSDCFVGSLKLSLI